MKKILSLVLVLTVVLTMAACTKENPQNTTAAQNQPTNPAAPVTEPVDYDSDYTDSELVVDDIPFVADTETVNGMAEAIHLIVPPPFIVETLSDPNCYDLETVTYYTGLTEDRLIYEWAICEAAASQEEENILDRLEGAGQTGSTEDSEPAEEEESNAGSDIPYRMMLLQVEEGQDASSLAEKIFRNMSRSFWNGAASDVLVASQGDIILVIMVSPEYAESGLTADAVLKAFEAVRGYTANVIYK